MEKEKVWQDEAESSWFLSLLHVAFCIFIFSALGPSNMLLRGARLKNVPYVLGKLKLHKTGFEPF